MISHRRSLFVLLIAAALGLGACERSPGAPTTEPSREAIEGFLMALQYGDAEGAFRWHVESTPASTWCASRSFRELLERVREGRGDAECERARAITEAQPEGVGDASMMLVQTMRFVCEQPEGRCADYSWRVFESGLTATPAWRVRLQGFAVPRIEGEGAEAAVAYVDLIFPEPIGTRHEAVRLVRTPLGWRVATPLSELF